MTAAKHGVADLALLGGAPAFGEVLHVGRPNIGDRAALFARLDEALDRHWLSNDGPLVREFEERVADRLGVQACVAVCNGTLGLELVARTLGLTGDVLVPSFTFVATAHAMSGVGLRPVFGDVEPRRHTLSPADVAGRITADTSAILGVHVWGHPCDVAGLDEVAARHGLRVFYDAAHAFDCGIEDAMVGNFGDAEVLSFHATKFVNAFEGGAVVTNDGSLPDELRLARNFGFAGYDTVVRYGTNAKMSEAAAAMGLTSLDAINTFVGHNRRNADTYAEALAGVAGIRPVERPPGPSNHQYVVYEVGEAAGIGRDLLVDLLWAENVRVRRYFHPGAHRAEPYRTLAPVPTGTLPVTERICDEVIVLPTGTAVDTDAVTRIADLVRFACANGPDIGRRARSS